MTDTELKLMMALAGVGLKSHPGKGYSAPGTSHFGNLGATTLPGKFRSRRRPPCILVNMPHRLGRFLSKVPILLLVMGCTNADARQVLTIFQDPEFLRLKQALQVAKPTRIPKGRAVWGDLKAPIVLVEYLDFQCPECRASVPIVKGLMKKYGKKLAVVVKHRPWVFHIHANLAARFFEAIQMQSLTKAYQFYEKVFENQEKLEYVGEPFLNKLAASLDLDLARLKSDRDSQVIKARLDADLAESNEFALQYTPSFLLNGVPIPKLYPTELFEQLIDSIPDSKR